MSLYVSGAWMKIKKMVFFPILAVVGKLRPRLGTRLAIWFYRMAGMNFVGTPTFVSTDVWFDGSQNYKLITLHEGCNISSGVRVLTHDWSPYCTLRALGRSEKSAVGRLLPVEVGPHAFIGMGAILMPGAKVGRGAIVGAGAVVRGNIPDFSVVIGNPAKIIGDSRDYVSRKFPKEWSELPSDSQIKEVGQMLL
ncbi:acyltransferase [Dietzia sp. ANT_WB102]|uniref:acyltransferase n=1 Tax=Dietzia sp. ANT_WB102 TaxID=2597345 RepID=UPI0011F00268|nr:acyltransferase [Dietzia sp. ANT_WB102]KAA0918903.1 acyltransferase [Dietzia sp. ANT_WB102]